MNLPITLPIFIHTDETRQLEKMELEDNFSLEECEERDMRFYVINCVGNYEENGITYTSIHSNGTQFICPYPPDKVQQLIENQ